MEPENIVSKSSASESIDLGRRQLLRGRFSQLGKAPVSQPAPTPLTATITTACLSRQGIVCFTCKEICPTEAISLHPTLAQTATPTVNTTLCTACGDCAASCPSQAIALQPLGEVAGQKGEPYEARSST
jgi:formate hydrogenlyase subunit 6/NADH:ubiquinone oxidoreductase subunit I